MPKPERLPWFAFYPSDFLSSTLEMSPATVGAYIRLLSHQWIAGSIPSDHAARVRICGGNDGVEWDQIQSRLVEVPGGWAHPRLLAEKHRSNSIAEKRRSHIAQVNSRRSQRHSDCDNHCDTTTTTPTDTNTETPLPPKTSDHAIEMLCDREQADREVVEQLVAANQRGVAKRLRAVGAEDLTGEVWAATLASWINGGERPYNAALKLTDNLKGVRDMSAVIRHRLKSTR